MSTIQSIVKNWNTSSESDRCTAIELLTILENRMNKAEQEAFEGIYKWKSKYEVLLRSTAELQIRVCAQEEDIRRLNSRIRKMRNEAPLAHTFERTHYERLKSENIKLKRSIETFTDMRNLICEFIKEEVDNRVKTTKGKKP